MPSISMHKFSLSLFIFIIPIICVLPLDAVGDVYKENAQIQTLPLKDEAHSQRILNNVSKINNELSDIIDCYWQIAVDLGFDTIAGIGQAHGLTSDAINFIDSIFGDVQNSIDGISYTVGPINVDFGISGWLGDDEELISFGPWTVTAGEIPFFADITDNLEHGISEWATVACEVRNAITNNCEQRNPVANFPNADYGCWRECRMPYQLTRIWVNLVALARLVEQTTDAAAKQEIVAVGGGNLSLLMEPISVVVGFTRLVADNIKSCDDEIQSAEIAASYIRLAALRGDHIYSDSVFNEYRKFDLRTRIEINLSGHGSHPHPIAIFQLPSQFGGYLELAREIVAETINDMKTAGESVGDAEHKLAKGDAKYFAGEFKKAYKEFGAAYRAATKIGGGGNDDDH